jgi:hypothetical protein
LTCQSNLTKLALLTFFLALHFTTQDKAWAQENLRFFDAKTIKEEKIVQFLQKKSQAFDVSYVLSRVDLNDDFINEYVLKPKSPESCPSFPLCPYSLIALQNRKPILIGQFDAHKIILLRKKNYGVHQISVYNKSHNDFASTTALWDPHKSAYVLSSTAR